ncbi:MAG: energy transducer TonB [Burkholderiales bacterium]
MTADSISALRSHNPALLMLCVAASVATHVLVLTLLPAWNALRESPPRPLTVELAKQEPPEIVLPKPLPMETRPERLTREPVKPVAKPVVNPPVQAPILTAPPEAPPSPAAPLVPEQRPAPPPEVPRPPSTPVVTAVTPPRSDAAYLNNPRPAYPLAARRRGDQGTVLIRVLVSADGLAASVGLEKTSGHPSLDEAALSAVKSWRFVPARQGGQAIESPYVVPVVFKLD